MRGLTLAVILAMGGAAACRPREKIRVESPQPEVVSSVVDAADASVAPQLIRGFHHIEQESWRWTAGSFSVALKPPPGSAERGAKVVLRCNVADAVVGRVGPVTLTAKVNGGTVGSATWSRPGEYTFTADIPTSQLDADVVTVDFQLDKFLAAGQADSRELGLIVSSISLELAG